MKPSNLVIRAALSALLLAFVWTAAPLQAGIPALTVDILLDEADGNFAAGDLSLREALSQIDPGGTISFAAAISPGTIQLTGVLNITRNVTINGSGITLDGRGLTRILEVELGDALTMNGLTLTRGLFLTDAPVYIDGTATFNNCRFTQMNAPTAWAVQSNVNVTFNDCRFSHNNGTSVLLQGMGSFERCVFHDNQARSALLTFGTQTLRNCTFSGNTSNLNGGAIDYQGNAGTNLVLINCTFAGNRSDAGDGGALLLKGPCNLVNNLIADNFRSNGTVRDDLYFDAASIGLVTSANNLVSVPASGATVGGFQNGTNGNLIGTLGAPLDAKLITLADNGGGTLTRALRFDSPALDTGNFAGAPVLDQRGVARVGGVDIGAYELAARVELQQTSASALENAGSATLNLVRTGETISPVQVTLSVSGGTATTGADIGAVFPLTVTLQPGETSKAVALPLLNDTAVEPDETVLLVLTQPINARLGSQVNFTLTLSSEDLPPPPEVVIASIIATPNPSKKGQAVNFAAAVNQVGTPLHYAWNFGDGTGISTAGSPDHVFAAIGSYPVVLTVTDSVGRITSAQVVQVVNILGTTNDIDGDGFSNDIEAAQNSDPDNPLSTPGGLNAATNTAVGLAITQLRINISEKKRNRDQLELSGTLPVPGDFENASATALVDVGGIVRRFSLGSSNRRAFDSFTFNAQTGAFKLRITRANLKTELQQELNERDTPVSIVIVFNKTVYSATAPAEFRVR